MNTTDTAALLPCPFCGSSKVGIHSEHDSDTGGVFLSIKCSGCRASSGSGFSTEPCPQTYQEVRDEWNRRATTPQTDGATVALTDEQRKVIWSAVRSLSERADELKASNTSMDGTWCDAEEQAAYDAECNLIAQLRHLLAATHAPAMAETQTDAAQDVLAERQRQVTEEGWTPQHDDKHADDELSLAAACYALEGIRPYTGLGIDVKRTWPLTGCDWSWWKPKDRRRNLVKAGALILAEIERIDRAAASGGEQES